MIPSKAYEEESALSAFKNLADTIKSLKRKGVKPKVCPKCGSTDVGFSSKYEPWLLPEQYVCKSCGFKGPLFVEVEEAAKERQSLQKNEGS